MDRKQDANDSKNATTQLRPCDHFRLEPARNIHKFTISQAIWVLLFLSMCTKCSSLCLCFAFGEVVLRGGVWAIHNSNIE
eukprot:3771122-Amphidinium_carterae.1